MHQAHSYQQHISEVEEHPPSFYTFSKTPTRISIGIGWTAAKQEPAKQTVGRPSRFQRRGIPRRDCNFGNYHYMLQAKPLRHAQRRRGMNPRPSWRRQAFSVPFLPYVERISHKFSLDLRGFARYKINMASCRKLHLTANMIKGRNQHGIK